MTELSSMAGAVGALLKRNGQTVAVAESSAGGLISASLLAVPGASRTVLEAMVPYGQRSLVDLLGHEPEQYVSLTTARELARWAYDRGIKLNGTREGVVGVGCTASIATDRPKRGEHRCCVAARNSRGLDTYDLVLEKGKRDK